MKKKLNIFEPIHPIILARIGSAYGIYGWLKLFSFTDNIKNILSYHPWFIKEENQWKSILLESWKYCHKNLIIKIKNVDNRETAKLMKNYEILTEVSKFPTLNYGNYYWKDIIGCQVITITGYKLGKVIYLIETFSNDVLVVKTKNKDVFGIRERLIPFLYESVIKHVDIVSHIITVDWNLSF